MGVTDFSYRKGQALPAMSFEMLDADGAVVDLSSGWTATVYLALASTPTTAVVTLTGVTTLAATSPNIVVSPTPTTFDGLTAADEGTDYAITIKLVRSADSYPLIFGDPEAPPTLRLLPAVA